jgi:gluconate/galactonate dehydratase
MSLKNATVEELLSHVNTCSSPSNLRITDVRFACLKAAPYPCILVKIYTNQGIVGLGELRDIGSKVYGEMLKSRLIGENPCNIEKLFRRLKQFGNHGRQGGGVSGVEIALWDIAGKAYGIPVYQMLGGKFRDRVRIYCDTDCHLTEDRSAGEAMGLALKKRMERGYTMLKMDVGIGLLKDVPDALCAPLGYLEGQEMVEEKARSVANSTDMQERFFWRNRAYDYHNTRHPFTGVQVTEKGLDYLEQYVEEARSIIGYQIPLAVDHMGFMGVEELIKLARRLERFNLAWMEDCIPWQYTDQWVRLANSTTVPMCLGEDIYLKESFETVIKSGGISVVHPDPLTAGGILETKKIGDIAWDNGVRMCLHMAASPVAAMAATHIGAATENFLSSEFHSNDVPWWDDLAIGTAKPHIVDHGFITVPDRPGLGIDDLNDEVIKEHVDPRYPEIWGDTAQWDSFWSQDRQWN